MPRTRKQPSRQRADARIAILGFASLSHLVTFALCFLPFVTFSCGARDVVSQSAIEIARGKATLDPVLESLPKEQKKAAPEDELDAAPWVWILPGAALLAGAAGLVGMGARRGNAVAIAASAVLVVTLAATFVVRFPIENHVATKQREMVQKTETSRNTPMEDLEQPAALAAGMLVDTRRTGFFQTACALAVLGFAGFLVEASMSARGRR